MSKSTAEHSATDEMSRRGVPRGTQGQRAAQRSHTQCRTLERTRSFLGKSQAMKVSASTALDVTTATTYRRAMLRSIRGDA